MKTTYKIFLIIFLVILAGNLYFYNWSLSLFDPENTKFVFSVGIALLGILLLFVLNTWSKLGESK